MKITFGRIFEQSLIAKTKSAKELQPFIDWIQGAIDNIARAMTSNLSVADNLDARFYYQAMKSTTVSATTTFKPTKVPKHLSVSAQTPVSPALVSFTWQMLPDGNCQINCVFGSPPIVGVQLALLAIHS
jgi:hypothetical protein